MTPSNHNAAPLADPIADEVEDGKLTDLLVDALADLRPDPNAFAAGVRQRLQAPRPQVERVSPLLRAAASVCPIAILPSSLKTLLGAAGAAQAPAKLLPTVLLFPLATVGAIGCGFVALARRLGAARTEGRQRDDRELAEMELRAWWQQHRVGAAAVAFAIVAAVCWSPIDAMTLLLLALSATVMLVWSHLARAGLLSPAEVGRRFGGLLFLALLLLPSGSASRLLPAESSAIGPFWVRCVLLAGGLVCIGLSRARQGRVELRVIAVLATLTIGLELAVFAIRPPTVAIDSLQDWQLTLGHGDAKVEPRQYLSLVRSLQAAAAAGCTVPAPGVDLPVSAQAPSSRPEDQMAAIDLGWATADDLRGWAASDEQLLDPERRWTNGQLALAIKVRSHQGGLDEALKHRLGERLLSAFAQRQDWDNPQLLLAAAELLEELGLEADGLRPHAVDVLHSCLQVSRRLCAAAFLSIQPAKSELPLNPEYLNCTGVAPTAAALLLMRRIGVPSGIGLEAVERFLALEARQPFAGSPTVDGATAFAARMHARTMLGLEPLPVRGFVQWLVDARALLAAVLFSLVGIAVTWRSRTLPQPKQT